LIEAIKVEFPHFEFEVNSEKPRRQSFEIELIKINEG
jgi:hypothetical protein